MNDENRPLSSDESSLFIVGDDLTTEDALDILANAVIRKRNHLDGFGTAHFIEALTTIALGSHELAVFRHYRQYIEQFSGWQVR